MVPPQLRGSPNSSCVTSPTSGNGSESSFWLWSTNSRRNRVPAVEADPVPGAAGFPIVQTEWLSTPVSRSNAKERKEKL